MKICIKSLIRIVIIILIFWDGGWYVLNNNHLDFRKFISIKRPSVSTGKTCFCRSLLDISSLANIIIPPSFLFLSCLKGSEKPSTRSWDVGNVSSSFVSVITRMSTYFKNNSFNWSNLFRVYAQIYYNNLVCIFYPKLFNLK